MKKVQKIGLAVLMCASATALGEDVWRSYFNVREYPIPHVTFQSPLVENAHNNGRAVKMKNFETFVFGSKSTQPEQLARYFLFNNNTQLTVRSNLSLGNAAQEAGQDVLAQNFNIAVTNNLTGAGNHFHSVIKIRPEQTIVGGGFAFRKHFREFYWASIEFPIVHVKNNVRLTEQVQDAGGPATGATGFQGEPTVANMVQAFKQQGMKYGRIEGPKTATGVPDITLRLGWDAVDRLDMYVSPYFGVVLPSSNKPKGVFMFEPITGNGGHVGLIGGTRGELDKRDIYHGKLWWSWYVESRYLLENTQKRSFDLYANGPWSRYLSVWPTLAARNLGAAAGNNVDKDFGINYLTQDVKVTPGLTFIGNNQLTYIGKMWNAGVGMNIYVRQAEKIKLVNTWKEGPIVASVDSPKGFNVNNMTPLRTIGTEGDAEKLGGSGVPYYITQNQINLGSAAHPSVVSHMVYGIMGLYCPCKHPRVYQAGLSYEFSRQNTAVNRWGLWGKAQISF